MIQMTYNQSLIVVYALAILTVVASTAYFGLWHPMWTISLLFVWKGLPWLLRKIIQVVDLDPERHTDE